VLYKRTKYIFLFQYRQNFYLWYRSKYQFNKNLSLSIGYQYLLAKDRSVLQRIEEGKLFNRNPIIHHYFQLRKTDYFGLSNRSKHTANLNLSYEIPTWKTLIYTMFFYKSRFGIFDSNQNAMLNPDDDFVKVYYLINFSIQQGFKYGF
jgi:outer membrane receptor for ferrienterochelin and colicins